jgi:hypothetical protein
MQTLQDEREAVEPIGVLDGVLVGVGVRVGVLDGVGVEDFDAEGVVEAATQRSAVDPAPDC